MLSVIFQRSNQALRIAFRAIQHIVPVKQVTLVQNLLKMKLETLFFINERFLPSYKNTCIQRRKSSYFKLHPVAGSSYCRR